MNKTFYICKYTPVELLTACSGECEVFDTVHGSFEKAESAAHPNICGFGKSLLESALNGEIKELVLVNCCDTIKSVYEILEQSGKLDFLYMTDILKSADGCSIERTSYELKKLLKAYTEYKGTHFDVEKFKNAFSYEKPKNEDFIAVLGARASGALVENIKNTMPVGVRDMTCVNNRNIPAPPEEETDVDALLQWYAGELLGQLPCMRMHDSTGRKALFNSPNIKGVIYHTIKFCDFYTVEYNEIKDKLSVPVLKTETDYSSQSNGQIMTRLEAFKECFTVKPNAQKPENHTDSEQYYMGIDSGSTSTDVVILDRNKNIVSSSVVPTGAGASSGAQKAVDEALKKAGLEKDMITSTVATGYGREYVKAGGKSITEITCHAKGAHFLNENISTVIDIGGQDSKVITLAPDGNVLNFVMNDKCAAGTGRFLEFMARTLEMNVDEMSETGIKYGEDLTISSMCTVFAESEVVSLISQNKNVNDIVHGLNKAVASKTVSLVNRAGGKAPFMMTGGVSKNKGLVKELEEKLGEKITVCDEAQICGALGAALFAAEG